MTPYGFMLKHKRAVADGYVWPRRIFKEASPFDPVDLAEAAVTVARERLCRSPNAALALERREGALCIRATTVPSSPASRGPRGCHPADRPPVRSRMGRTPQMVIA